MAIDMASGSPSRSRTGPTRRTGEKLILALASFSAVSAIGGGIELVVARRGSRYMPPIGLLEHTPFQSFLVPGVMLAIIVGGAGLLSAVLVWRRSRAAIDATVVAGAALTFWIVAEAAIFRAVYWLHLACGAVGISLLGLGVRAAWQSRAPRHRWIISVTIAETVGYLAPACTAIIATKAGLDAGWRSVVIAAAGLVEGLALGIGQATAFPLPLRRLRYAVLTSLAAGVVWLSIMSTMLLAENQAIPPSLVAVAGMSAGLIGLAAIGGAQWIELRHHAKRAHRWIAWSALAWLLALPLSFAPGPFVDESTPFLSNIALWATGGMLMAYVMALVTWQGVRRLTAAPVS
jgi:hypothetical protein